MPRKTVDFKSYTLKGVGELLMTKGLRVPVSSVSSEITLTEEHLVVLANNAPISLPSSSDMPGKIYIIKNVGNSNISVLNPGVLFTIGSGETLYVVSSTQAWVSLNPT